MTLRYLDVRLMQAYNLKVVPSQGHPRALQILALECFKRCFPKPGGVFPFLSVIFESD